MRLLGEAWSSDVIWCCGSVASAGRVGLVACVGVHVGDLAAMSHAIGHERKRGELVSLALRGTCSGTTCTVDSLFA